MDRITVLDLLDLERFFYDMISVIMRKQKEYSKNLFHWTKSEKSHKVWFNHFDGRKSMK